jgi:hypothetical protein
MTMKMLGLADLDFAALVRKPLRKKRPAYRLAFSPTFAASPLMMRATL